MAGIIRFDGIDRAGPNRDFPHQMSLHRGTFDDGDGPKVSVHDIAISKHCDDPGGGSGDDILIGGTTGYDEAGSASPTGTGDLADWQGNYGGSAAAAFKMHRIGYTTAGATAADGDSGQGMTAIVDGGLDLLLGDGSVRGISPRDTAFLAYDQGFLGGVSVAASDVGDRSIQTGAALVFAGDRYDAEPDPAGGLTVAVADVEAMGLLMTAGFLL
jgi:hypothetical protein